MCTIICILGTNKLYKGQNTPDHKLVKSGNIVFF